jgi:osmoprotectant transport system substrate-binding protein
VSATTEVRPPGPLVPPANLRRELVLVASGLVLVLLCGLVARNGRVGEQERAVFRAVNDLPGWLYPVLWPIQQLGNLVAGPAIALIAALCRRWRLALGALIVSFIDLEPIMKSLVVRERPGTTVPDAVLRGDVPAAGQSFPSGHAVLIASLAVLAAPYFRGWWRIVPWALVAGVCIGRVYVGAHNPLDVVAGCGLGLVIGGIVSILVHLPIGPHRELGRSGVVPQPSPLTDRPPTDAAAVTELPRGPVGRTGAPRVLALLAAGSLVALGAGCGGGSESRQPTSVLDDDAITVGSFDFAESELLAEIYSQALEREDFHVQRAFRIGPRELVAPALSRGLVELVPDYAGTAVQFLSLGAGVPGVDVGGTHQALVRAAAGHRLTALAPAPAQTANTFVVARGLAERFGLRSLSDLAAVAPQLTLGGPPECPARPSCLVGLRKTYGLDFERFVSLDAGGPLTQQALRNGDIDVALLFTTDPAVTSEGIVELADDRSLQPAENVTPLVNTEVVDRWGPDLVAVIDEVSRRLTTAELRDLNAVVASGATVPVAAADWLKAEELS